MKILILAAMDKELQLITNILRNPVREETDGMEFHKGEIAGHEVYAAKCGIGKVNAAVNTLRLIDRVNPDLVINSGVAGGAGMKIGSVLVADKVAYHDVWCGPGTEYGEADGFPLFFSPCEKVISLATGLEDVADAQAGLICTGDKFISTHEEILAIRSRFPDVLAVDMESAAIAQVCAGRSVPFSIIRVVSDTPGEGENLSQYQNFWADAPHKTFNIVRRVIERL